MLGGGSLVLVASMKGQICGEESQRQGCGE